MAKTDTRVKYTKKVLQDALLEILKTKNIDRVTVKEICEKADINRGTFYLHYSTPNDLLYEIENTFLKDHSLNFTEYMENTSNKRRDEGMDKLQMLFQATLENIELCKIIFGPHGDPRFNERIKKGLRSEIIEHWHHEFPNYKLEHLDYIFDYVISGSMSLILSWIEKDNEQKLSAEELANRLDRLGHYCHLAIQEFN